MHEYRGKLWQFENYQNWGWSINYSIKIDLYNLCAFWMMWRCSNNILNKNLSWIFVKMCRCMKAPNWVLCSTRTLLFSVGTSQWKISPTMIVKKDPRLFKCMFVLPVGIFHCGKIKWWSGPHTLGAGSLCDARTRQSTLTTF